MAELKRQKNLKKSNKLELIVISLALACVGAVYAYGIVKGCEYLTDKLTTNNVYKVMNSTVRY